MIMISCCSLAHFGSGASLFVLSAMLSIRRAIAVNNRLVPTEPLTAKIIDPFCLAYLGGEDIEVEVVDFSTCAYSTWLVGPTGVIKGRYGWWISNAKSIPLLGEIKDMVARGRGLRSKSRWRYNDLVFVKVRGVALLVVNKPRSVVLALTGHPGADAGSFEDKAGILAWFIKELASDIEALQKKHVDENACERDCKNTCDSESSCSPSDAEPGEDDTAKAIVGGLEVLRASSAVRFATWEPFQKAFKITKMNTESIKEFNVVPPKKRKATKANAEGISHAFDSAVAEALLWAESEELPPERT